MSQPPSTPVKVPPSAANNSAATLDPDLRSQINTILLKDGHISKIHDTLLHALNSNSSNWPTQIQAHALSILRSGEATTYPELLRKVLDDIRLDNEGGATTKNGNMGDKKGLALPKSVIDEALRTTRESLETVCDIDENGAAV